MLYCQARGKRLYTFDDTPLILRMYAVCATGLMIRYSIFRLYAQLTGTESSRPKAGKAKKSEERNGLRQKPVHDFFTLPPSQFIISVPGARPMAIDWVRGIRDQCLKKEVPFFFKQWGGVHKKKAGRTLDGCTWGQMPVVGQPVLG